MAFALNSTPACAASDKAARIAAQGSGLIATIREAYQRHRIYRDTVSELNALTQRELDDMGITRSMITRLALEAAYGRKLGD